MFHLCGITAWCLMAVVCALGTAVTAKAQNVGLDIRMPKVEKVIEITADGVNLRKAPSATAPRLMWWCEPGTDICDYVWSDQKQYKGATPSGTYKGGCYLVVDETDEWYGIMTENGIPAYVSKKFAQQIETQPITPEMLTKVEGYGDKYQKPGITKGIYRGYAMIDINGFESDGILFGRIVNGVLVFNHHTGGSISFWEDEKRISAEKEKDRWGYERLNITYGPKISIKYKNPNDEYAPGYDGQDILDMEKLTTAEFADLLKQSGYKKGMTGNWGQIYVGIGGNVVHLVDYDITDPLFKDKAVTIPANLPTTPEIANPNDPKPVQPYRISKVNPKCNYAWRGLSVKEVLITHEGTLLKMEFDNRLYHEEWININRQATVSIPGTSIKAKLTHKKDIEVSPGKTLIGPNEVKTFYLQFEPLPKDTRVFDFHETPTSRWKITGISVQ